MYGHRHTDKEGEHDGQRVGERLDQKDRVGGEVARHDGAAFRPVVTTTVPAVLPPAMNFRTFVGLDQLGRPDEEKGGGDGSASAACASGAAPEAVGRLCGRSGQATGGQKRQSASDTSITKTKH